MTKQRIMSEVGHLSNNDAAEVAVRLAENGVQNIIFGHVSSTNNSYDLVYENAVGHMQSRKIDVDKDVVLGVVQKNVISAPYIF